MMKVPMVKCCMSQACYQWICIAIMLTVACRLGYSLAGSAS